MGTKRRPNDLIGFAAPKGAPARSQTIDVLDMVRLREDVTTEGVTLKAGAVGTAVFRHRPNGRGDAFEVEFGAPYDAVFGVYTCSLEKM